MGGYKPLASWHSLGSIRSWGVPSARQRFSDDCPLGFDRLGAFGHPAYSDRHVPRHDGRVWDAPDPCSGLSTLLGYCPGSRTVSEWRPSNCACLPWPAAWEPPLRPALPLQPVAAYTGLKGSGGANRTLALDHGRVVAEPVRRPSTRRGRPVRGSQRRPCARHRHNGCTKMYSTVHPSERGELRGGGAPQAR